MLEFRNERGAVVFLADDTLNHIVDRHPEISIEIIKTTIADPDEIRRSKFSSTSMLYYRRHRPGRYHCVVVKKCVDGLFISTALTTFRPKSGELIHAKKE